MPIFEYECTQCGEHTEHLQLSAAAGLAACPECGGEVRKLLSAPAFQFKGSGWYVTDYADKGKASGKSDDNGTGKAPAGTSKAADSKVGGEPEKASGSKPAPAESSSAKSSSPAD